MSAPIAGLGSGRVDHELAAVLVVEREGDELVWNRSLQRRGDGVDEPGQIEVGNHGIRDLEQQPEMVPLGRELPLRGLRTVEVQRVVDRHRHELRDLAQEVDVGSGVRDRIAAPETQGADPPACSRQRQTAEADDTMLLEFRHRRGPSCLGRRIGDDERLLRLDHPSRVVSSDRMLWECGESRTGRLEDPGTRDAAFGLKKDEAQTVEADDTLQVAG